MTSDLHIRRTPDRSSLLRHFGAVQFLGITAMLSIACGADPEVDESALGLCAQPGQAFEMGGGSRQFQPIEDGQNLWFTSGIQGGFHVWGALRVGEADPIDTVMQFELYQDGQQLGGRLVPSNLRCGETGYEYTGIPVELYFDQEPSKVADREMEMRVTLTERNGKEHTDRIRFIAKCCEFLR